MSRSHMKLSFLPTYVCILNANGLLPLRLVQSLRSRPRDRRGPASSTSNDLGGRASAGPSVGGIGTSRVGRPRTTLITFYCVLSSVRFHSQYEVDRLREREVDSTLDRVDTETESERASSAAALRARTTEIEGAAWCDLGLLEWMYLLFRVRWSKAVKQCDATEAGIKKSKTLARYLCNVPSFLDFLISFNTWKKTTSQFFIRTAMFSCFEKLKWSSTNITSISGWMVQTIIHFYHIGRKLSH